MRIVRITPSLRIQVSSKLSSTRSSRFRRATANDTAASSSRLTRCIVKGEVGKAPRGALQLRLLDFSVNDDGARHHHHHHESFDRLLDSWFPGIDLRGLHCLPTRQGEREASSAGGQQARLVQSELGYGDSSSYLQVKRRKGAIQSGSANSFCVAHFVRSKELCESVSESESEDFGWVEVGVKMCDDCRPLGFLIGLPFMLVAAVLSLIGMVLWVIATILGCCCPCFICCAGIANIALSLIKAPFNVIRWFTKQIPC